MDLALKWLNPGAAKQQEAIRWKAYGGPRPVWTSNFAEADFTVSRERLYFRDKVMLTQKQKRMLIKQYYFNPKHDRRHLAGGWKGCCEPDTERRAAVVEGNFGVPAESSSQEAATQQGPGPVSETRWNHCLRPRVHEQRPGLENRARAPGGCGMLVWLSSHLSLAEETGRDGELLHE